MVGTYTVHLMEDPKVLHTCRDTQPRHTFDEVPFLEPGLGRQVTNADSRGKEHTVPSGTIHLHRV